MVVMWLAACDLQGFQSAEKILYFGLQDWHRVVWLMDTNISERHELSPSG